MSLRGLEAINSAHGWAITLVGIITVFLGLFGLFVILSELHKLILLWANRSGLFTKFIVIRIIILCPFKKFFYLSWGVEFYG